MAITIGRLSCRSTGLQFKSLRGRLLNSEVTQKNLVLETTREIGNWSDTTAIAGFNVRLAISGTSVCRMAPSISRLFLLDIMVPVTAALSLAGRFAKAATLPIPIIL